jgi:hypothetical protein
MIDVAAKLKLIDKKLGKQIRARGASFHEWYVEHTSVRHFATIEIINSARKMDGPLGDVEGHYSDAKFFLSTEIKQAIMFMEDFLITILDDDISYFIELIGHFNLLVKRLSDKRADSAQTGE